MSTIKRVEFKNFIGIKEFMYDASEINILAGPKGTGKSSVLEGIEKAFTNNGRRTELINHDSDEATLFIETTDGLKIDRRIRETKSDYLKLKQDEKGIKSTEAELRKLFSGECFDPTEFVNKSPKEQTKEILAMIKMNYPNEDIIKWFDNDEEILSNINTDKHLLQILKDIEVKLYNRRTEVNSKIRTLESQCQGILDELPKNYNGDDWRDKNLQEYYGEIQKAKDVNRFIEKAKELQENINKDLGSIANDFDNKRSKLDLKYKDLESDCKDIITLANSKIDKAKNVIENADNKLKSDHNELDLQFNQELEELKQKYSKLKNDVVVRIEQEKVEQNDLIEIQKNKIITKNAEIDSLLEKKELEEQKVESDRESAIKLAKERVGKAAEYLENHEVIDIEPLQAEAEEVTEMQSYIREWDRYCEIKDGKLASLNVTSAELTKKIEVARTKPTDLIQMHEMPLEGITIDSNSLIRINNTLLDGLSDGEKLEVGLNLALQKSKDSALKIMILNNFDRLNASERQKAVDLCEKNDIQIWATITQDTETENTEKIVREEK